ncbi:ribulose-phosphate 3-epimerase [Culicoidibacter larvae]|uniref:Ribulose-phosphate 3-epimerase n=1 Tax=Culicoidibacter larvae TaxID=2579976 RepID=A0A5R8QDC4_9FIRM|nr:ribulose-phosphate 3-epimerase [Culicoidibacter larvae]TLG75265.1 ribulose-phosphate 3-epimerase [Culicoidibacter larvae]
MIQIAPSLLAADFGCLAEEINKIELAGAHLHHVDVMDGMFVPNISFGPVVIEAIAQAAKKPLDIHLMIEKPERYLADYLKFKPKYLTVHFEATTELANVVATIREAGSGVGLSIKPDTPVAAIIPWLDKIDLLLVMSVEPGFGGQKFQPQAIEKISEAKAYIEEHDLQVKIEVDGGIDAITSPQVIAAGAEILVAGSAIYSQSSYAIAIEKIIG